MEAVAVERIQELAAGFPAAAKDTRLNLKAVLVSQHLTPAQAWGTALACAYNEGRESLIQALLADGREASVLDEDTVTDARAAAALMSMNNVFYRFRHMMGNETYNQLPARLRMQHMMRPATDKATFELFSLAVSAINGCEMCLKSHEAVLRKHDVKEAAILDAVRIAAVIRSAAVSLGLNAA